MHSPYSDLRQLIRDLHPYGSQDRFADYLFEFVKNRLGGYFPFVQGWMAETDYVEREWRGCYSTLYSKTYYKKVSPYTLRIHLFSDWNEHGKLADVADDTYMGYLTLRPLPVDNCSLSKICLRPARKALNLQPGEDLYMLSVPMKIHLAEKEVTIHTFPFFSQDAMVTVCAHADILMMTTYLHKKYPDEFSLLKIRDLYDITYQERYLPSRGITAYQMTEILCRKGYNAFLDMFNSTVEDRDSFERLLQFIDCQLESAFPVILAFDGHVSLVVGHTLDSLGRKRYIVCDDSGYHFRHALNISDNPSFCDVVSPDRLKQVLSYREILAISCEFNRAHLRGNDVKTILETYFRQLLNDDADGFGGLSDQVFEGYRLICLESAAFKKFFAQNKMLESEILDKSLPHYLWLFEVPMPDGGYMVYLVDASAHKHDLYMSIVDRVFTTHTLPILSRVD